MTEQYPWGPLDPLGEALQSFRMEGAFYVSSELRDPWSLEMPPFEDCLSFHVLTSGSCSIEAPGTPPVRLQRGDFVLVAQGLGHRMYSEADALITERVDLVPQEQVGDHFHRLSYGGDGPVSTMTCGVVSFRDPLAREVLGLLPPVIHITGADRVADGRMQITLDLLAAETREPSPGGEAVTTRLADILVVQTIRWWVASQPGSGHGILAALRDPQLGRALLAFQRDPGRRWTVASLAKEAAMSRSAFAARFTQVVGKPAMRFVAGFRMQLAPCKAA